MHDVMHNSNLDVPPLGMYSGPRPLQKNKKKNGESGAEPRDESYSTQFVN